MNTVATIAKTVDSILADIYFQEAKIGGNIADYKRLMDKHKDSVQMADWTKAVAKLEVSYAAVVVRIQDMEKIFVAAGGWTRFFAVIGGHLHKTRACSSCFPTTQFAWMPEFSGEDEAGVVNMAGEFACTVCFPDAPVNKVSMLPMHVAEREAAAERTFERKARAEQAANDKIVVGREVYKTLRAAENRLSYEIESFLSRKFQNAADDSHRAHLDRLAAEDKAAAWDIIEAIKAKYPEYDSEAVVEKKTIAKIKMFNKHGWEIPSDFRI